MRAAPNSRLLRRIIATMQTRATIARGEELYELRRAAAAEFGAARRWRLTPKPFGLLVLARGSVSSPYDDFKWPDQLVDHPFYFRRANRRAVGVVSHLYGVPPDLAEQAAALGLAAEELDRGLSWYWPGEMWPVVFTRTGGRHD